MTSLEPSLRVRINQIDYSLAQSGVLDNSTLPRVPVIRIFGDSSLGKKTCVHVHQVYPYFFIEYLGRMDPGSVNRYIARLSHSLNHAIAISMKRNPHSVNSQFVRAIILVKGVHFYGFHASHSPFLKIYIIDPAFVNRAVTILQSGTVMKTRFLVYESHLSYPLQFLCDFGLYGCGWLDLGEVWDRGKFENQYHEDHSQSSESLDLDVVFKPSPYLRQSRMPLEVDVAVHQILNRHLLSARNLHHELKIPAPSLPTEHLVLSVRELWDDERRRRLAKGLSPSPDVPKDPSEKSRGPGGGWVSEVRWWDEIKMRIERERDDEQPSRGTEPWERWVMTTFESVEALWEDEHKTWRPSIKSETSDQRVDNEIRGNPYDASRLASLSSQVSSADTDDGIKAEVDEAMLASQAMVQMVATEEAEWEKLMNGYREQEAGDDERLMEDGPPPDLQDFDDQPDARGPESAATQHNAFIKDSNPFECAWTKLAEPSKSRPSSVSLGEPSTPRKRKFEDILEPIQQVPRTPASRLSRSRANNPNIMARTPLKGPPFLTSDTSGPRTPMQSWSASLAPTVPASHVNEQEADNLRNTAESLPPTVPASHMIEKGSDGQNSQSSLPPTLPASHMIHAYSTAQPGGSPYLSPTLPASHMPEYVDEQSWEPKSSAEGSPQPDDDISRPLADISGEFNTYCRTPGHDHSTELSLREPSPNHRLVSEQNTQRGRTAIMFATVGSAEEEVFWSTHDQDSRPRKKWKLVEASAQEDGIMSSTSQSFISASYALTAGSARSTQSVLSASCRPNANGYLYKLPPPSATELLGSIESYGLPSKIYQAPYYSKENDAPEHSREYAGLVFHLKGGNGLATLDEWKTGSDDFNVPLNAYSFGSGGQLDRSSVYGWEYAGLPPSARQMRLWLNDHPSEWQTAAGVKHPSQIEGPTQANPYGLKHTPARPSKTAPRERRNMSVFSLEMFAPSKDGRLPDPENDEIAAVFWSYQDSDFDRTETAGRFFCDSGIIAVRDHRLDPRRLRVLSLDPVSNELDLLNAVIDMVVAFDPDILTGWEIQTASWGYLNARAQTYGYELGEQISRAPGRATGGGTDQWGVRTTSTFKVVGRHVLNAWRIIRSENSFTSYTFENAVFQILHRRTPRYTPQTLTDWYHSQVPAHTVQLLRYFSDRTVMVLEILDASEVVIKNAEFARIFGVDFFSVISRGSQFKVESFMFRIAKPESFVLLSPSKQDVGKQNAAECMPLIMEPLSAFYNSPLVVLDFQSLYPSVMIAYNYCYSTCLGRITDFKGQYKFGVTDLRLPPGLLDTLKEYINVAANGIMYVKPGVRKGLLGRMLSELLDTRVMVKQAMKGVKDDKALRRVLDARQLALKYIANVTYGYTSATYSGRMPAVEIADSIVQSGRETLEKAIRVIDSTKKWGAKVVYGDTDSLFVYLRGKTKEQAFRIGQDMADTITAMNPAPIKLKFEKVYLPCVLLAKKRYVGFKFESADDTEPIFDAKGIETVRRDGVPAQQKMTETCLKILFRTQDLSKVKDYCYQSWSRMLENRVSIQDFIFSKEVRMGTYSDKGPPPPGVAVAARRMLQDPNDEPQYGDRIPYVIIRGDPGSRLVDRAVAPEVLLENPQMHLDAAYYISRVLIPPLERVFNLVGADVRAWFDDMPRALRADLPDTVVISPRKSPRKKQKDVTDYNPFKIDEHFSTSRCILCGAYTDLDEPICEVCLSDPQIAITGLLFKLKIAENRVKNAHIVCSSCCGNAQAEPVKCVSLDCPWLFERKKAEHKVEALVEVQDFVHQLEEECEREGEEQDENDEPQEDDYGEDQESELEYLEVDSP
ncbi:hypothetical protein OBBRIDRAFT_816122 [Obba rivulosa]|uniref:DNA polymerase n=1 Tax=Obba rivulosa TaxID=1052685 RepID=A0A8E2DV65_9APHY|nr:hypothetical protein OBBRIDRAFT_816122 [Obba rivulosa]